MLPYPPASGSQVVCSMEEDAPSFPLCTPYHSDPQPLHSLSRVTCSSPGCGDGEKGDAGRCGTCLQDAAVQAHQGGGPAQGGLAPSSPRPEGDNSPIQVTQSLSVKLVRIDAVSRQQKASAKSNESCPRMGTQSGFTKHNGRVSKDKVTHLTPVLQSEDFVTEKTEAALVACESERELEMLEPLESPLPVKRWVIGPLLQSLKSKVACFTDIVMSPVRLFKPSGTSPTSFNPCSDSATDSYLDSDGQGRRCSEGKIGGRKTGQGQVEVESKSDGDPDSCVSEGHKEMDVCDSLTSQTVEGGGPEGESGSEHLDRPRSSSAQVTDVNAARGKGAAEGKILNCFQEEGCLKDVEKEGRRDSSREQQMTDGVRLRRLCTKRSPPAGGASPHLLPKRSPSSACNAHTPSTSAHRQLLMQEDLKAESVLKNTTEPTALETNTSARLSPLTSSIYYTPPDSFSQPVTPQNKASPTSPLACGGTSCAVFKDREVLEVQDGPVLAQLRAVVSPGPAPTLTGRPSVVSGDEKGEVELETYGDYKAGGRGKLTREGKGLTSRAGDNAVGLVKSSARETRRGKRTYQTRRGRNVTDRLQFPDKCHNSRAGSRASPNLDTAEQTLGKGRSESRGGRRRTLTLKLSSTEALSEMGKDITDSQNPSLHLTNGTTGNGSVSNDTNNKLVDAGSSRGSCSSEPVVRESTVDTCVSGFESGVNISRNGGNAVNQGMESTAVFERSKGPPDIFTPPFAMVASRVVEEVLEGVINTAADVPIHVSVRDRKHCRRIKRKMDPEIEVDLVLDCKKAPDLQQGTEGAPECSTNHRDQRNGRGSRSRRGRPKQRNGNWGDVTEGVMDEAGPDKKNVKGKKRVMTVSKRGGNQSGEVDKVSSDVNFAGEAKLELEYGNVGLHPKKGATTRAGRLGHTLEVSPEPKADETLLGFSERQEDCGTTADDLTIACPQELGLVCTPSDLSLSNAVTTLNDTAPVAQITGLISKGSLNTSSSSATIRPLEIVKSENNPTIHEKSAEDSTKELECVPLHMETGPRPPVRSRKRPVVKLTSCQVECSKVKNQEGAQASLLIGSLCLPVGAVVAEPGKGYRVTGKGPLGERHGRVLRQREVLRNTDGSSGRRRGRPRLRPREDKLTKTGEQRKEAGPARRSGSIGLLRSRSCPEIPTLLLQDHLWSAPLLPSSPHSRPPASSLHQCLLDHHPPSPARRARRHTVCSLEVEREIAPLCLRKEVYPVRQGGLYCGPSQTCFTSLTVLASCFLSSPLAFLSRKLEGSGGSLAVTAGDGGSGVRDRASSLSRGPTIPVSVPSAAALPVRNLFAGPAPSILPRPGQTSASISTLRSVSSQAPLGNQSGGKGQQEEDRSSFSLNLATQDSREEKALSDSEIKADGAKRGERGKVSRFRIRKTPPKPLTNLTPMGLPKPVRLKKKEFSLEEIYTNKNFRKPPEGRLETIFEVPVSSRDGSLSMIGQRRLKRLVEFPEVGVARKPKKPLVGSGAGGSWKAGGGFGRTRRGAKEGPSLTLGELDSLLCSKLEQLDCWIAFDQAGVLA